MDEAGLPEEDKESLKVLHYLLEGHMSIKAHVGFVAITNHVLDAAKSNRCFMLLRQEPDANEMLTITRGVLFDLKGISRVKDVDIDGELLSNDTFALCLCNSYEKLLHRIGNGCRIASFKLLHQNVGHIATKIMNISGPHLTVKNIADVKHHVQKFPRRLTDTRFPLLTTAIF